MISCPQKRLALPLLAALTLLAAGCSSGRGTSGWIDSLTPYKVEVVQGNVVTKEMAEQVKVGMTRQQVRDVLGAPLLTDPFHTDRWDYVFTIRRQGTIYQQRRVTAMFGKDDRLASFEADELPSEREFVASIDSNRSRGGSLPVLELTPEQIKALPRPERPAASAVPAPSSASLTSIPANPAPTRSYPPLEPGK
ncbi:outer membrane protein assembly factor BamE [Rivibacter subsaxonicus]|uniref:Outer membrane protein assembly factor BamE n=1 Tax=Rivibacter subsaxonicus TaxID=457575 RepID=A0A4Q7VVJ9_9BURK|nr:outer membrane protein assembly factor BamE [Rivibacter subsaxonicus]RZU00660.1 Beta-barrel assembly machine subunit BamE [Rivibacter subsaxonicus]